MPAPGPSPQSSIPHLEKSLLDHADRPIIRKPLGVVKSTRPFEKTRQTTNSLLNEETTLNRTTASAFLPIFLVSAASTASAALTVTLTSDPASPAPAGTSIRWTATVSGDPDPAPSYVYKFTAELAGFPRVTRTGFMRSNQMVWTPSSFDGNFTVDVVVKNLHAGTSASATAAYTITSRVIAGNAAVTATANPLVALFSGPACLTPIRCACVSCRSACLRGRSLPL